MTGAVDLAQSGVNPSAPLDTSGASPSSGLLSTKLYIPRPRRNLVPRRRLTARLNAGMGCKLTLISAPAGFGKTMLLSEWIPTSERCVTWVSLDQADNEPVRFWAHFIAALQMLHPSIGELALALFRSPQPAPTPSVLTTLVNEIDAFPDVFALVLDDYHLIETQAIHDGLAFLLDHMPPRMHLTISTRTDPPLPMARLRGGGQLTELREADLRFTTDEAAAFLNQVMALGLSAADIAALEARTEGWIAGLQLAALGNMLGKELGDWFGTRRWLVQTIVWLVIINGLMAFIMFLVPLIDPSEQVPPAEQAGQGLGLYFAFSAILGGIGMVILTQDEIIQEKQTGTAAWILSKPVSRNSFILTKLLSNLVGGGSLSGPCRGLWPTPRLPSPLSRRSPSCRS